MKLIKYFIPLGMIGVFFYFAHVITGELLWKEYNSITMDISSLTADGAPNYKLLRIINFPYGVFSVLFAFGMVVKSLRSTNRILKAGFIFLLIMEVISIIGYGLFPLTGDKTEMNSQNSMHLTVTALVVFTTIASGFCIAIGYRKEKNTRTIGNLTLLLAVLITVFGSLNPINMAMELNILGLTERLCIYTVQVFIFVLSYYNTFVQKNLIAS
jgi:hypothetical protein